MASIRVVVVGAGAAGREVVRQIRKEKRQDIQVVGFIDDAPKKQGISVGGVRIIGTIADLKRLVRSKRIDQILVSTPSVGKTVVERVTKFLPPTFPIKILPSVSSVLLGKVDLSYIRDINPSDLIGRPLVKADQMLIAKHARGKKFLVTGGAGSIGSEIVRQLIASGAKKVAILDAWEEGVFNMTEEFRGHIVAGRSPFQGFIGNIRDKSRIDEVFKYVRPDVVIHAAAYKHVPLMEANSGEAQKTNFLGTKNILDACVRHKVKDFLLISTDKAVHPSSVMGKTKRDAELLMRRYAKKYPRKRFFAVRFGNVLNSSGSVLPIFLGQIRRRAPVTITHKDMTRYFMTIPEAVSLVLLSWIVGKNGQILLLDMGERIKIYDFAIQLIKMHGLVPHRDIAIEEIGMRKGEKIHEELAYDIKALRPSGVSRVFIAEEA